MVVRGEVLTNTRQNLSSHTNIPLTESSIRRSLPVPSRLDQDILEGQRCWVAPRAHDVLAASLICVSGQIVWVDRRAAGTGFWHGYVGEGPDTGGRNLLTLDERLEELKS